MRPFIRLCFAALALTAPTFTREAPTTPVAAREPVPAPVVLTAASEPQSDPCADYDALEAGTGEPSRQEVYNGQDARGFARWRMACLFGWDGGQFACLDALWGRESGWHHLAHNSSGAHGVPQALPGSKMGAGWWDNPRVQVAWGLAYISDRYGSPCAADGFQRSHRWY